MFGSKAPFDFDNSVFFI